MKWMMPEKTEWAKECNTHEPTRSYGQEIYELTKKHGYKNALEIGCAWGVSTLAILQGGNGMVLSVDVNPQTHANEEVEVNGFRERWSFHHSDSTDFFKQNELTFDYIYVDGSHKYPKCQDDLFMAWECLQTGGILIADDFTHPKNQVVDKDGETVEYGVSFAVCNLIKEKRITRIDSTTRLLIMYK